MPFVELPLLDKRIEGEIDDPRLFVNPIEVHSLLSGHRINDAGEKTEYTRVFRKDLDGSSRYDKSWYVALPIDEVVAKLHFIEAYEEVKSLAVYADGIAQQAIEKIMGALFPQKHVMGVTGPEVAPDNPGVREWDAPEKIPNGIHEVRDREGDRWYRKLGRPIHEWHTDAELREHQPSGMNHYGPFQEIK